jgi:hypothetical protein
MKILTIGGRVECQSKPGVAKQAGGHDEVLDTEMASVNDENRQQDGMGHGRRGRCFTKEGHKVSIARTDRSRRRNETKEECITRLPAGEGLEGEHGTRGEEMYEGRIYDSPSAVK